VSICGAGITEMPDQAAVSVTSVRHLIRCGTDSSSVVAWYCAASSVIISIRGITFDPVLRNNV